LIKVSVILPTVNRKTLLMETLRYLEQQVYQEFEVIVVDQSDIKSQEEEFGKFKFPLRYFHLEYKNLPAARNKGIVNAWGEILLFLDDDIIPDKFLIQRHVFHYKDKRIGAVAGKVVEDPDELTNSRNIIGVKVTLGGRTLRNLNTDQKGFTWSALGANMSLRKEAVDKVGPFDGRYIGTAVFEETDYCYRLRAQGYKIFFEPEAALIHLLEQSAGCREANEVNRIYYLFHNSMLFYLRNMPRITIPYFLLVTKLRNIANFFKGKYGWRQSYIVFKGLWNGYKAYSKKTE